MVAIRDDTAWIIGYMDSRQCDQVKRLAPTIEQVRSLQDAANVMRLSWSENNDQPLDYTPEFLQSCLSYPHSLPALSPALYIGNELAAFVFGFPRTVEYRGRTLNLLLMTFFTVGHGHKGMGLGSRIWAECATQARNAGYDGAIHYCVDGNRSNEVTVAGFRRAGSEAVRIFTIPYLMRFLKEPEDSAPPARDSCEAGSLIHASQVTSQRVVLSRKWSLGEAEWQCEQRAGAVSACTDYSIITGYTMRIADSSNTVCTFVEDVFWGDGTCEDQLKLLDDFIRSCARTSRIMIVPLLGYASAEIFRTAGFRRSRRILHAYLTLWNGMTASPVQSMYIDVL